jgi:hypothetical protein
MKEAVFSVGAAPSFYNEDLTQLALEIVSLKGAAAKTSWLAVKLQSYNNFDFE